ncbi:MAG: hypothetical protein F6K04_07535 [Leptolyngbya sp. SIO4C5]|nr:hypothetical protein [Leptolyngbya sp. SIO4C5]
MYTADFAVINDWGTGFTANLIITNLGNTPLDWSHLTFDAPFTITHLWNGELLSQDNGSYVITQADWNGSIAPGSSIAIGFNGRKSSDSVAELTNFNLTSASAPPPPVAQPSPPPALTIADIALPEGNGAKTAEFQVRLSSASAKPVTVRYETENDSAIAGQDYAATSGLLTFAPGETLKTIAVPILGDRQVETDETFQLRLQDPSNGTLATTAATATLKNDDVAPPLPPAQAPTPSNAISFEVTNDWGDGFVGNITLRNTSPQAINGWTLRFEAPFSIEQIWNARSAQPTDGAFSITPLDWNQTLAPGESVTFGFVGAKAANIAPKPVNFTLDGAILTPPVTVPSTPPIDSVPPPSPEPIPPATGAFNYAEALQKSFLFYEAQRSGDLPATNRIEWRGDSALQDGSTVGRDLSGGYYDAGDHVKFGLPMAYSMTMLSWGVHEYRGAYDQIGQLDEALDAIKWGTDYLLKAHVTDANGTQAFWGQVGDGHADHSYWGSPEAMTLERPAFKIDRQNPGTDLAAEAAAALAAASIIFRPTDAAYADTLLTNSQQLYAFADAYRGKYSDAIPDAQSFYNSWSGYNDELAWGATWLYQATGNTDYLQQAESIYQNHLDGLNPGWTLNWDDKSYGVAVLLAQQTDKARYQQDVEGWLNAWVEGREGVNVTEGGLRWISQWGSLRYAANTAFAAGVYADTVDDPGQKFSMLAETTVDYLLGDNPRNASYMVGFGNNSPLQPHHRSAHGGAWNTFDSPEANQNILFGALVGGPNKPDDFAYQDSRTDYIANEVALDYNAGLTGALARLVDAFGGTPLSNSELNALPGIVVDAV